jgi:hypothetical protein
MHPRRPRTLDASADESRAQPRLRQAGDEIGGAPPQDGALFVANFVQAGHDEKAGWEGLSEEPLLFSAGSR